MSTDKSWGQDSHRTILKFTSIIASGTLLSRIFGFIRDIVLAKLLGTGMRADAFFVAFKIPNLFRDIAGEGAANSAVIPVFSEYVEKKNKEELWNFVSVILILSSILLSVISVLGIVFAPVVVRVLAPGFIADTEKLNLTIQLTRVMFPYLIFIGLTAYSMAILFSLRSFASASYSPCLLNVAMIISMLVATKTMKEPVFGLAIGVLIGGVLQLLVQIPPMLRQGIRLVKPKTLAHPGAKKIGSLLVPRLFGSAVYQLTVFIDTFCASLSGIVGVGGISAIYYANRIIQLPMGVFSIAIASAILPTLSGLVTQKNFEQHKNTLIFSLKNIFFILIPIAVFLALMAEPIIRLLFQRGEFDQYSTAVTSQVLFFYSAGLVSFGGIKIMVTVFHSLQDTKTPVKVAAGCLLLNAFLNFLLMKPLKVGGIALASTIAGTVNFLLLFYLVDKKLGGIKINLGSYFFKVVLASFVMAQVIYLSFRSFGAIHDIAKLVLVMFLGIVSYFCLCYVLKVEQVERGFRWILRKK